MNMANKNHLGNLLDTFAGYDQEDTAKNQETETTLERTEDTSRKELLEKLEISSEMEAKLDEVRKQKVGRPKGRKNGDPKPRGERATFIVNPETIKQLKYIALVETRLYKDVIEDALCFYISSWKDQNGEIKIHQPKKKTI